MKYAGPIAFRHLPLESSAAATLTVRVDRFSGAVERHQRKASFGHYSADFGRILQAVATSIFNPLRASVLASALRTSAFTKS